MAASYSYAGIALLLLWIAGKGLAFGKDVLVSYYFGVSALSDAYFVASGIPSLIYAGLHATVPLVLLPQYSGKLLTEGIGSASRYASGVLNCYAAAALVLSILTYGFADWLVALVAPALEPSTAALAGSLTRIFAVTFVFSMASAVLTTIQLAHKQVYGTQLVPIANNGIFILGVYMFARHAGIYAAAVSAAGAWLIQVPLQWLLVRATFRYVFLSGLPRADLRLLLLASLPALLSASIESLNLLVGVYFGSALSSGAISALSYAARLLSLFTGVFLVVTTSITYPEFSRNVAANETSGLSANVEAVTKSVLLLALPMAVIVVGHGNDIVALVFARGAFAEAHVSLTSSIVSVLAISIPLVALRDVYLRAFYAMRAPGNAMAAGLLALAVNVATSYALVKEFETTGLATAIVLSSLASCVFSYLLVQRTLDTRPSRALAWFCFRLTLVTALGLAVIRLVSLHAWVESTSLRLVLGAALIASVFLCGYLLAGFLRFDASSRTLRRSY